MRSSWVESKVWATVLSLVVGVTLSSCVFVPGGPSRKSRQVSTRGDFGSRRGFVRPPRREEVRTSFGIRSALGRYGLKRSPLDVATRAREKTIQELERAEKATRLGRKRLEQATGTLRRLEEQVRRREVSLTQACADLLEVERDLEQARGDECRKLMEERRQLENEIRGLGSRILETREAISLAADTRDRSREALRVAEVAEVESRRRFRIQENRERDVARRASELATIAVGYELVVPESTSGSHRAPAEARVWLRLCGGSGASTQFRALEPGKDSGVFLVEGFELSRGHDDTLEPGSQGDPVRVFLEAVLTGESEDPNIDASTVLESVVREVSLEFQEDAPESPSKESRGRRRKDRSNDH